MKMILKTFTSLKSPDEAIKEANQEIEKMVLNRLWPKEIAQSQSVYYNSFSESEEFHFTLTILFEEKADYD